MQPPEPYLIFIRKLNELGLRYMVSGSVAAIYYGEPRMTNDVDIILFLRREDSRRLIAAFPEDEFYCPPLEVIESERSRDQRGHFNLIHHETGFKADIYLTGRDELHAWGFNHAVKADVDGETIIFAPPEYVMVRKLQFYREGGSEKHLRDIHRMITALGDDWQQDELQRMLQELRLEDLWQRAMNFES